MTLIIVASVLFLVGAALNLAGADYPNANACLIKLRRTMIGLK